MRIIKRIISSRFYHVSLHEQSHVNLLVHGVYCVSLIKVILGQIVDCGLDKSSEIRNDSNSKGMRTTSRISVLVKRSQKARLSCSNDSLFFNFFFETGLSGEINLESVEEAE